MIKRHIPLLVLTLLLPLAGCESVYYDTMEKFGVHKRDILVDRVTEAQEAQEEAKEQFQSALEQFTAVLNFDGGDLQSQYDALSGEFERSESRATEVRERIDSVEDVALALFDEWTGELNQYSNQSLKRSSERTLAKTRKNYERMIAAMRRAESKIEPVLDAFRDQTLFLKHNLNAQAIASLKGELGAIESDVAALIRDMEASIREANSFVKGLAS